ncbi:hypothetical protein G6F24_015130 [Rhizopus arrhizus]|nr:hypothetical protein G6F24_015130 [Rhizopus arrhizus]
MVTEFLIGVRLVTQQYAIAGINEADDTTGHQQASFQTAVLRQDTQQRLAHGHRLARLQHLRDNRSIHRRGKHQLTSCEQLDVFLFKLGQCAPQTGSGGFTLLRQRAHGLLQLRYESLCCDCLALQGLHTGMLFKRQCLLLLDLQFAYVTAFAQSLQPRECLFGQYDLPASCLDFLLELRQLALRRSHLRNETVTLCIELGLIRSLHILQSLDPLADALLQCGGGITFPNRCPWHGEHGNHLTCTHNFSHTDL